MKHKSKLALFHKFPFALETFQRNSSLSGSVKTCDLGLGDVKSNVNRNQFFSKLLRSCMCHITQYFQMCTKFRKKFTMYNIEKRVDAQLNFKCRLQWYPVRFLGVILLYEKYRKINFGYKHSGDKIVHFWDWTLTASNKFVHFRNLYGNEILRICVQTLP